jgi:hypothetical protein
MAENLGFFEEAREATVAVEERPQPFSGLMGMPARNRVPVQSSARSGAARDLTLCLNNSAEIAYSGKNITVLPGVRRATGAALKTMLGIYRRMVLFLKEGENWRRIDDNQVVDLSANREAKAEFNSVPRVSRD